MSQLDLLAALDVGLCRYGQPESGASRLCSLPATHRAVWLKDDGRTGGIDCCREHASYYASAWVPYFPGDRTSAWIDVLT